MARKWEEREWEYYQEVIERFDLGRGNNSTVVKDAMATMKEPEKEGAKAL